MDLIREVQNRIVGKPKRIVFPESSDPRVLHAALHLEKEEICGVTLIGNREEIRKVAAQNDMHIPDALQIDCFENFEDKELLVEDFYQKRKHKGINKDEAREVLTNPLFFGASMVANKFADGCVAGSQATTGEVIRAALQCIGLKKETSIVSSIFLMVMPGGEVFTYGDCGVVPYPDAKQLADIAIDSAHTHKLLTGIQPKVAMLSFSTKGSAVHERTRLVTDALELVKQKTPNLDIDGELQFDAAYVPDVAKRKAPDSPVAGKADVFIFPNLDAGNIAYKITERLAGAAATGPILQGLNKPMMDLSRGCNWKDIVNAACVALLMGEEMS